jgi:hypothetical protein
MAKYPLESSRSTVTPVLQVPGPNVAITLPIAKRSSPLAARFQSTNFTTSPKNPATPNAAPTRPNASSWSEDFDGLITSVTKFGFFVELTDLFIEGLVPLNTLTDDYYTYHENTRQIIGQRSRKTYSLGQRIRVLVDRIDPVEKKIQFAVLEERPAPKRKRKKAK